LSLLENLVSRITDPDLRSAISQELASLKKDRTFGLVFEPHEPEVVPLPGLRIHQGSLVQLTKGSPGAIFRVERLEGDSAALKRLDEASDAGANFAIRQLVPVKSFGRVHPQCSTGGSHCSQCDTALRRILGVVPIVQRDSRSNARSAHLPSFSEYFTT
jgi:adenine-specific DNA-methyltransferase